MKIEGSTVVLTGSSRGIGRALVDALLARGASKVYATARNTAGLEGLDERVVPIALDVTDAAQVRSVAADTADATLLVNNAGHAEMAPAYGEDFLDAARREFEVNYFGVMELIRAYAPILKDNGGGTIANVVSVGGLANFPLAPSYSDSKAAVHSATQAARILLAGQGTHVVGIYPGPVDTAMAATLDGDKATPASVADAILDGIEAGRTAIFPDAMARNVEGPYEAGTAALETQFAPLAVG